MLTKWLNYMVDALQDTRSKILSAAISIFREKGRDGAKMQEIADQAGINKAMLHYYFRTKDQLFEEVFKLTVVDFFSTVNGILFSAENLEVKIRRICETYISMAMDKPYMPVFIIAEMNRNPNGFFKKLFNEKQTKPDFIGFKKQVEEEIQLGNILSIKPMQLIMDILSLSLFPVVSRPMMQFVGGVGDKEYVQMMEERKKIIPEMIWASIQKK